MGFKTTSSKIKDAMKLNFDINGWAMCRYFDLRDINVLSCRASLVLSTFASVESIDLSKDSVSISRLDLLKPKSSVISSPPGERFRCIWIDI